MATREVYISLKGDNSDAKRKVAEIEARLKGIEKSAIKLKLDINDKQLKDTLSSVNKLKDIKLTSNADQITSQFQRLGTVTTRFNEQLAKGAKSSTLLGTQNQIDSTIARIQKLNSQQVGDLFKNASSSIGSLRSGIDNISSALGGFLAKASQIGAVFAGAATAAVVSFGKTAIQTFETLENSKIGLKTLLGEENAIKTIDRIKKEAANTPFELGDLSDLTLQLAAVTKDGDKAINTVLDLGKAVTASGKGTAELNNVAANLVQIASTGKVTELDIRQFQRAIPVFNDVIAAAGLTTDGLKNSENAADLLFGAFEKAGKSGIIANAFTNAKGSLTQLKSNLKDALGTGGAEALQTSGIIDGLKNAIGKLTDFINKNSGKLGEFLKPLGESLKNIDFGAVLDKASQKIPGIINTIINNFKRIKSEITPILKTAGAVIAGFLEKVGGGDKVQGAIKTVEGLVKAFIGLKVISPILGGLSSAFSIFGTLATGGKLSGLLGIIQGFGGGASGLAGLASGFSGLAAAIVPALPIIAAVAAALGVLYLGFRKIQESDFLKGLIAGPIKIVVGAFKALWESLKSLYQALKPVIDVYGKFYAAVGAGVIIAVVTNLALALTALALVLKVIADLFRINVAAITAGGKSLVAFFNLLKTGNTKQFVSDMKAINSEFGKTVTDIGTSYKTMFTGMKNGLTGVKTEANATKLSIDGIRGALEQLSGTSLNVESLKLQFESAKQAAQEALTAAGGDTTNSAYREAKIRELETQNSLNTALAQEKELKSQLAQETDKLVAKSAEGAAISEQEKASLLEKIQLYRDQQAALGLNTTELDNMIGRINTINTTPADAKTTTNAPETVKLQEGVLVKQDEINAKPATAQVKADDQASGPLDSILKKLFDIVNRTWSATVNVATSGVEKAKSILSSISFSTGGVVPQYRKTGGLIYANKGYAHPGNPRGSDVVPAWLTPGEGVIRRSSMSSIGKDMFNSINKYGNKALQGIFNQGFKAGNSYTNNKTANTTVNITNNNPGAAISTMLGLNNRINGAFA